MSRSRRTTRIVQVPSQVATGPGDIEALTAKHQEDIYTANSKKIVLQKQVKRLFEQKAAFESNKMKERHKNELEDQLARSLESNRVVTKDLQKAFEEAKFYIERMHQMNYSLEQEPSKYADVDLEIKMRDERCSNLATRADACLDALDKLENKSKEDQQAACTETADLRITPGMQHTKTECLEISKETLQCQSEETLTC
ncbi:hypothetical protein MMC29_003055 [Sticta canariensis]|nr:hypothetical protein [Sticta canariensis]